MRQVTKLFGQPESPEAAAVRQVLQTDGYAQAVVQVDYVDHAGNVVRPKHYPQVPPPRAAGERYTLTEEAAAYHDQILAAR